MLIASGESARAHRSYEWLPATRALDAYAARLWEAIGLTGAECFLSKRTDIERVMGQKSFPDRCATGWLAD